MSPNTNKRKINIKGTYIEGNINIKNGDFIGGNQVNMQTDFIQWFAPIRKSIENRAQTDSKERILIKKEINEIQNELGNKEVSASFVSQKLTNLKKIAPDIWEVAITTLINPPTGLTLTVQKIIQKLKKENEGKKEK